MAGASWEGFVIETLTAAAPAGALSNFYRTAAGAEIDLLLTLPGQRLWAIEIKRSLTPKLEKGSIRPARTLLRSSASSSFQDRSVFRSSVASKRCPCRIWAGRCLTKHDAEVLAFRFRSGRGSSSLLHCCRAKSQLEACFVWLVVGDPSETALTSAKEGRDTGLSAAFRVSQTKRLLSASTISDARYRAAAVSSPPPSRAAPFISLRGSAERGRGVYTVAPAGAY
ncbi:DUF4143 domain-containing protein [Mesorhizobium sp. M1328]|uniref:DUF4143 domain-containing protein n=1 Tax=Mesorhizobium sp. M1328 TaxID=2957082 RepID=UPI00333B1B60